MQNDPALGLPALYPAGRPRRLARASIERDPTAWVSCVPAFSALADSCAAWQIRHLNPALKGRLSSRELRPARLRRNPTDRVGEASAGAEDSRRATQRTGLSEMGEEPEKGQPEVRRAIPIPSARTGHDPRPGSNGASCRCVTCRALQLTQSHSHLV
jgi:hypothetical protein